MKMIENDGYLQENWQRLYNGYITASFTVPVPWNRQAGSPRPVPVPIPWNRWSGSPEPVPVGPVPVPTSDSQVRFMQFFSGGFTVPWFGPVRNLSRMVPVPSGSGPVRFQVTRSVAIPRHNYELECTFQIKHFMVKVYLHCQFQRKYK